MSISESNTDRAARLGAFVTEANVCIKHADRAVDQETLGRVVKDLAELVRKLAIEIQTIELGPAVSPFGSRLTR